VTLKTYFQHPSLVIYFFATPPGKLGLQIGGGLLITNHLDQLLWLANGTSNHIISHCFLQVHTLGAPFHQPPQTVKSCWAKTMPWAKPAYFDFSLSNFNVQCHILSTAGDGLTTDLFILLKIWKFTDACDQGFNQFYPIENWAKFSLKKEILIPKFHKQKKSQKNPKFSKSWQKKFTLRKEKIQSNLHWFFFQKTFANLFVQEKNDKFLPKNKNKNKKSL